MLKSWSIENFKAIVNSGELKLAPVTVLAGLNSSGKSSLLQSILMIAQTLSSRLLDRALLPNERIVQLGTFEDVLFEDVLNEWSGSRKLTVGFELVIDEVDEEATYVPGAYLVVKFAKVTATFTDAGSPSTGTSAIEASNIVVESILLTAESEGTVPVIEEEEPLNFHEETVEMEAILDVKRIIGIDTKQNVIEQSSYLGEFKSSNVVQESGELYSVALSHFLPTRLEKSSKGRAKVVNLNLESINQAVDSITHFLQAKYVI